MSIRQHLKAFWWLRDGSVAGMGRPGFNRCHWFDLSIEEGNLLSWLGKQTQNTLEVPALYEFLNLQAPKLAHFYGMTVDQCSERLNTLHDKSVLQQTLETMNDKAAVFEDATLFERDGTLHLTVTPNRLQLQNELKILKENNVSVVISLLEEHLNADLVAEHFEVHHFSVEDLNAPDRDQVYAYADVLHRALSSNKVVATHCLAGIGRTTTMLFAAHLLGGHSFDEVAGWVSERNPHFQLRGRQVDFLKSLANDIEIQRTPLLSITPGASSSTN